jgi:hypothetical protein
VIKRKEGQKTHSIRSPDFDFLQIEKRRWEVKIGVDAVSQEKISMFIGR